MERHKLAFSYGELTIVKVNSGEPFGVYDVRWAVEHMEVYEFLNDIVLGYPDLDTKHFIIIRDFFLHMKEEWLKNR